ncbi:MAG: putative ABC exporter domain-containing protein [Spirochaetaceae bacterium]|nr:putative ABC exporter domain-containing protein [Spirochaetaceae bacterium]
MNSLVYLVTRSLKNGLLELFHKPAKMVLYIFCFAGIIGLILLSNVSRLSMEAFWDIIRLKGIFFLLILLFITVSLQKGLSTGDAIFDMNDVNLLFVSPVSPRVILIYGLVRMTKIAFYAGFFILFQSNSVSVGFGVGFDAVLLLLLGFFLAVLLLLILSMVIYSVSNGRPRRKLAVKLFTLGAFLPLAVYGTLQFIKTGDIWSTLEKTLASRVFAWTPVAGWASEGVIALIRGELGTGFLFLALLPLTGVLLIMYIVLSKPDYYEDVLVAAERTSEKKRSIASGQIQADSFLSKKTAAAKTGIGGSGAASLFYKHLRESFRANPLGLWGLPSISLVISAAIMAAFMRNTEGGMLILLQILMWIQIFLIGTGRGLRELYFHYIYLIPESSFSKILWSNLELILKVLVESFFMFIVAGLIVDETFPVIAAAILSYSLFSLLLAGVNFLSLRWIGADISHGVLLFIYIIAVVVIMLPGLIGAIIAGSILGAPAGLGILSAWELLAALVCFALSRDILHRSDMPVIKTRE